MAFNNTSRSYAPNRYNNGNNQQREDWQATSFLNISLPSKDGGRTKLHGVPLKITQANQQRLIEAFRKDPEKAKAWVLANIDIEFRENEPSDDKAFAIEL